MRNLRCPFTPEVSKHCEDFVAVTRHPHPSQFFATPRRMYPVENRASPLVGAFRAISVRKPSF
ncbi:hypothetical protein ERY430_41141 [Erythrobacter sp. EC-HK427]|nr:hypothetical protein ERY430_41141 [Erythrobacter sp. EC-HK427]